MKRKLPPEAFDIYVGLGIGRGYQAVANHYGVSKGTVTALAKRDDWQSRLVRAEREARNRADEKAVETLEQVNERHLKIARALQAKALDALRSMSLQEARDVIRALDLGVKQERVILGEPSDRTALSVEDIRARFERWTAEAEEVLPNGRGDDTP